MYTHRECAKQAAPRFMSSCAATEHCHAADSGWIARCIQRSGHEVPAEVEGGGRGGGVRVVERLQHHGEHVAGGVPLRRERVHVPPDHQAPLWRRLWQHRVRTVIHDVRGVRGHGHVRGRPSRSCPLRRGQQVRARRAPEGRLYAGQRPCAAEAKAVFSGGHREAAGVEDAGVNQDLDQRLGDVCNMGVR